MCRLICARDAQRTYSNFAAWLRSNQYTSDRFNHVLFCSLCFLAFLYFQLVFFMSHSVSYQVSPLMTISCCRLSALYYSCCLMYYISQTNARFETPSIILTLLTHIWDIGKQCRPRSDAAQGLHCLLRWISIKNKMKSTPDPLKVEMDSSNC